MQSEIYNIEKPCAAYWTRHRAFLFLTILSGTFDALCVGHPFALHGIRRYVAKPQKVTRSRAPAARYCKSRNDAIHTRRRQILHESGKHWFFSPDSKPFCPKNSVNLVCLQSVYSLIWKTSWQRRLELNQSWWSEVANTYPYFWLIGWIYVRFRVEKQGLFLL